MKENVKRAEILVRLCEQFFEDCLKCTKVYRWRDAFSSLVPVVTC